MELVKLTEEEFDEFASNHECATFLQTRSWARLKNSTGWDSELLGFKKNKKIIAAMSLLSKVTPIGKKMFYAPRGFLLDYNDLDLLEEFSIEASEYVKNSNGIFLKIDPYVMHYQRDINGNIVDDGINNSKVIDKLNDLGFKEKFSKPGEQSLQSKWMYWIRLKDKTIDDVMKDMTSKTRQMIRKNEKNGVVVREGNYDDLEQFKHIMDHTSERREFLSRSLKYYQDMYHEFGDGEKLKLYFADLHIKDKLDEFKKEVKLLEDDYQKVLVQIENGKAKMNENKMKLKTDEIERTYKKIDEYNDLFEKHGDVLTLGAIFYFVYGKEVLSFIGGAYEELMEFQPFYTIHYEMIKYAVENKYEYYNFYGISSDLSEKDPMYGVYLFKKGFGGEVVELIGEYDLAISKFYYFLYEFSYKILRRLKKLKTKKHSTN